MRPTRPSSCSPVQASTPWSSWARGGGPGTGRTSTSLSGFTLYAAGFLGCTCWPSPGLQLGIAALTRQAAGPAGGSPAPPLRGHGLPAGPVGTGRLGRLHAVLRLRQPLVCVLGCVRSLRLGMGSPRDTRRLAWHPWLTTWVPPFAGRVADRRADRLDRTAEAILRKFQTNTKALRGLPIQVGVLTAETAFLLWLYLGASA